jgi:predicted ATPase
MLKQIEIKNFKAWRDSGPIRLAPLTIFCGTNSSGKSSIAQFLLMLKQTVESSDRKRVLHLGDEKSLVDLGNWSDMIHRHEEKRPLEFSFDYVPLEPIKFEDTLAKKNKLFGPYRHIRFTASTKTEGKRILLDGFSYRLGKQDPQDEGPIFELKQKDSQKNQYALETKVFKAVQQQGRPGTLVEPENFFGFPDAAIAYYQNTAFLSDLSLSIKTLFKSIYYVGPLRESPERFYQFSGEMPSDVGPKGRLAINSLLAAGEENRIISVLKDKGRSRTPFEKIIAKWLKQMGLIQDFTVKPIAEGRKEYEVKVKIQKDSPEVLITDVGFGISQVLPVLVQCFYVPANSVILFEQPEIHLHPSVQAHLADMMIEAIYAHENGLPRNTQIILESHSEHLIRRIQRKIAEEVLKPEDVAIYFISQKKGESNIQPLEMDPYGNILNWPDNFFGDDLDDLTALALKTIERKKKEAK